MKKIIKLLPVAALVFTIGFSSCTNWLDVKPKSQLKDRELFSSESGFKEALAGVYSTLTTKPLYTVEMRFGMLDVLAHAWTSYSTSAYPEAANYDYTSARPERRIDSIWMGMYSAIANANVLLEEIDGRKSLFTGNNYSIIRGEALALRAFIHFDLVRCFGLSYAVDSDKPSIPYVTDYLAKQSAQLTVSQIVELALGDLESALVLLADDPIRTGEVITELDDNGYLINRQLHLNYHAVKALMARICLYKGDYTNAAKYAQEVIESGAFVWVSQNNASKMVDPSGAVEHIWGINVNNMNDYHTDYFSTSGFGLSSTVRSDYYDGITKDYRYQYLFAEGTGSGVGIWFPQKFKNTSLGSQADDYGYYNDKMPMLKLSEMYYILAECRYRQGGEWLGLLNDVRTARGIDPLTVTDVANFYTTLTSEFRKEFIGEGQMWFFYKRLNRVFFDNIGSDMNLVDLKAYTFPLPVSELQAADRKDNR